MKEQLDQLKPQAQQIVKDRIIYISGFSKEHYPIIQIDVHKLDLSNDKIKEQFLEAFKYVVDFSKTIQHDLNNTKMIFLLESNQIGMFTFPFMTLKKIIECTSKDYPGHLYRCFILNPSNSLYIVWKIIDKFIPKENKKKVGVIKTKEIFATLNDIIHESSIESQYGGNYNGPFFPSLYNKIQEEKDKKDELDRFSQTETSICIIPIITYTIVQRNNASKKKQQQNIKHKFFILIKKLFKR